MSWDPVWEEVHQSRPWGRYPPEELVRFTARYFYSVPDRKAIKILELGCGAGANLWYLAREGFDAYGVDGSKSAVDKARRYLQQDGLSAHLQVGDIAGFRSMFPGVLFEGLVDVACLYCNRIAEVKAVADEGFACLRPGGRILSVMLAVGSYGERLGREIEPGTRTEISDGPLKGLGVCHFFSIEEVQGVFREFADLQIEYSVRSICNRAQVMKFWVIEGVKRV